MQTYKDYKPETLDLLNRLLAAGFILKSGENGGDTDFPFDNIEQFLKECTACDEAHIFVAPPGIPGKLLFIRLVFGNEPGYLVCDYMTHPLLDSLLNAFADAWDGKDQATTTGP